MLIPRVEDFADMKPEQEQTYKTFQKFAGVFYNTFIDTSIQNPHYVPDEGPFVLVANHRSDLDPFLLIVNIKRVINWLAASYLWNIPGSRQVMVGLGAIPVSKHKTEIERAFDSAVGQLEKGQGVGIFPEGWDYISKNQFDWSVGEFNTGFARIAMRAGAPVVPVALQGFNERRGRQSFPPFIRKIMDYPIEMQYIKDRCVYKKLHINVGRPIPVPKGMDPSDRDAVKEFTHMVNMKVIDLYEEFPTAPGFEGVRREPAGPRHDVDPQKIEAEELDDAGLHG